VRFGAPQEKSWKYPALSLRGFKSRAQVLISPSHGADRPFRGRRYAVTAVLVLVAAFLWRGTPVAKLVKPTSPRLKTSSENFTSTTIPKVYPFSVIPGGAHSGEELARARRLDAVVARHYAGFGEHVAVESMPKGALMYVSYRKANQVYWTKTKHRMPQGELVLSDGRNLARTRCGNRLSPKPQAPVSSEDEPTEEAMDMPDGPKPTLAAANPVATAPEADFFIPGNPADVGSVLPPVGPDSPVNGSNAGNSGGSQNPYVFGSRPRVGGPLLAGPGYPGFAGPAGGTTHHPAGGTIVTSGGVAVVTTIPENGLVTPEPGTLLLLLLGLLLGTPTLLRQRRSGANTNRSK
jgi:hypothetical protein